MKATTVFTSLLATLWILPVAALAVTGPDDYLGDTSIYGASTATVKPNILIILDSSGSMGDPIPVQVCTTNATDVDLDGMADAVDNCPAVYNPILSGQTYQGDSDKDNVGDLCEGGAPVDVNGDYDPDYTYAAVKKCGATLISTCNETQVYLCSWNVSKQACDSLTTSSLPADVSSLPSKCTINGSLVNSTFESDLTNKGTVAGPMEITVKSGVYKCTSTSSNYRYYTGNYINWLNGKVPKPTITTVKLCNYVWKDKIVIAKTVVKDLITSTSGVNFGLMIYNSGNGAKFLTSSSYTTTIKDMDTLFSPGTDLVTTNRTKLLAAVDTVPASGNTPLGESLLEAARYFGGQASAFSNTVGITGGVYTSPIIASCQTNHIIFVTDGESTADDSAALKTICNNGDCDGDGKEPTNLADSMDDVAKYLYSNDFSTKNGTQNVKTYAIGFSLNSTVAAELRAINLLNDTAVNGSGNPGAVAYLSTDYKSLNKAFSTIINNIQETNSSFVAPVVPTSPENRAYSGDRVYLGFFKPMRDANWRGNIKKFSLRSDAAVLDMNAAIATDADGAFLATAVSFWGDSAKPDGPDVDKGGVGGALLARDFCRFDATTPTAPRMIYTNLSGTDLTLIGNRFVKTNAGLTLALLGGLADNTEKDKLIDYVHGIDVYDDDGNGKTNEKRNWILGDVLHFKPLIVNYSSYEFSAANESNLSKNKTVIYVGSNDGQLHAFRDADAKELWSFIPKELLPDLNNLTGIEHNYYIDASPAVYRYDFDNDGNVGSGPEASDPKNPLTPSVMDTDDGSKDKVVMLVALGRGGGINNLLADTPSIVSRGSYNALDVTDPENPKFLWKIDNTTTGFSELGESWSDPVIAKVRVNDGGTMKSLIVAFIGAGYDNNEDLRFGNTAGYPDATAVTTDTSEADIGRGAVTTQNAASAQFNPKGRGIYVVLIATLDAAGVPTIATTPTKLWDYTYLAARATDNPTCSVSSGVTAIDSDYNNYTDTLYFGDSCSTLWRCKIASNNIGEWGCGKIFTAASPADSTVGRKIIYKPEVTLDIGSNRRFYNGIYFGTGDRPHPLNEAVVDRMYAVWDYDAYAIPVTETPKPEATEANMEDVTLNGLQDGSLSSVDATLQRLADPNTRGWYIRLNENAGEKVLATPTLYAKVIYFTTFTPQYTTTDTCKPGDLGVGRVYAMNYKTGEAILNFDTYNDSTGTGGNTRASGGANVVLRRSDRVMTLSSGIPSGVVIFTPKTGHASAMIGVGGGLKTGISTGKDKRVFPLYWMMK